METPPLVDGQTLESVGDRFPECPGGPAELATMVLGDGEFLSSLSIRRSPTKLRSICVLRPFQWGFKWRSCLSYAEVDLRWTAGRAKTRQDRSDWVEVGDEAGDRRGLGDRLGS